MRQLQRVQLLLQYTIVLNSTPSKTIPIDLLCISLDMVECSLACCVCYGRLCGKVAEVPSFEG